MMQPTSPLRPSQRILDLSTGEVWTIVIQDTLFKRESAAASVLTEVTPKSYVYGCEAEGYEDERVVFHDQIGDRFLVLG